MVINAKSKINSDYKNRNKYQTVDKSNKFDIMQNYNKNISNKNNLKNNANNIKKKENNEKDVYNYDLDLNDIDQLKNAKNIIKYMKKK